MWKVNLSEQRIGTIGKNNYGSLMEVVEYNKVKDIWVKFLDHGNLRHTSWTHFVDGNVMNVYDRTLYGVGYLGEGKYKPWETDKNSPQYVSWRNMLIRCYSEAEHKRRPTYIGCTVADEWHNFQNFGKWFDENYYEIEGETMHLDKDILVKGNKIYSPTNAVFVPQRINKLFIKRNASRGDLLIGVTKLGRKYKAHCSNILDTSGNIGVYDTIEEAFQAYKIVKENYIKQVAEEYKSSIPQNLYEAMINYIVEKTD